jgi:serine/tyrosine/threonine adenylyltransferase
VLAPDDDPRLAFQNRFVSELPGDPMTTNDIRPVHGACYSRVSPTPVPSPKLIAHAREVAELLGWDPKTVDESWFAQVFAGNRSLPGMDPYAACYGGHQFGNWAGQLGDGRAITLGEHVNPSGERWELQLKGAGPTPYSRRADGRAVMRSSVREFLASEAMFHLGVPTTRALCLVGTGESVVRDMFYDGHPKDEPGAIVCRVAPSFLRFGSYEIFTSRRDIENLRRLVDYTLRNLFPEFGPPSKESILAWLREVAERTARLMVEWMRVGFVHGVMNTDNMSILGLTIDYGPYGWLEPYDPTWTPNTTDASGRRYRYGNQPSVGLWNMGQLLHAIQPLVEDQPAMEAVLDHYIQTFEKGQYEMIARKLGLTPRASAEDEKLFEDLFEVLAAVETDMTLFFRTLPEVTGPAEVHNPATDPSQQFAPLDVAYYQPEAVPESERARRQAWIERYRLRCLEDSVPAELRRAAMIRVNPRYVLRNYLAQLAIDRAEQGDGTEVMALLECLRRPYDDQPGNEPYAQKRPEWARNRAGCSMLSCSS